MATDAQSWDLIDVLPHIVVENVICKRRHRINAVKAVLAAHGHGPPCCDLFTDDGVPPRRSTILCPSFIASHSLSM